MNRPQENDKARLNSSSVIEPQLYLESEISSENQQIRCRICYDTYFPLVSLCNCNGSIGFVHQGCILDWITKKMETSQNVEIPSCEICNQRYSARMSVGRKKICYSILKEKVIGLKWKGIFDTFFYLLGLIMAILIIIRSILSIYGYVKQLNTFDIQSLIYDGVVCCFMYLIFPLTFIKVSKKHWKKRKGLVESSMVQIVEVTLLPKVTIGNNS